MIEGSLVGGASNTLTFTLDIKNPCEFSNISPPTITD